MKDSAGQRLRRAGLLAAAATVCVGAAVAGCTSQVDGNATANEQDLSEYRVEATSSSQAVTSSSRAASAARARNSTCSTYSSNKRAQVAAHNAFVKAQDDNAPDLPPKRQAAIDAHNNVITRVNGSLSENSAALSSSISSALRGYVDATRAVLVETEKVPPNKDGLNGAVDRMRGASNSADAACK